MSELIIDELTMRMDICDRTRYVMRKNRDGMCGDYGCTEKIDTELPWKFCRKHRREHAADQKKMSDQRVEDGLCVRCGKEASQENRRLCEEHRVSEMIRRREKRRGN